MSKLYYTDALASAYMARELGVRMYFERIDNEWGWQDAWAMSCIEQQDRLDVHPDSYHIFEPKAGDIMATVRPDSTSAEFLVTDMRAKEYEHLMTQEYAAKIIHRNNKPFFNPEKEDV